MNRGAVPQREMVLVLAAPHCSVRRWRSGGAARALARLASCSQAAGKDGCLVADLRDCCCLVPEPPQRRAEREDGATWPPGPVEHGTVRVGVDAEPQRIWPGQPVAEEVTQQRVGGTGYVCCRPGSIDQPARGELGFYAILLDADAQVPGFLGDGADTALVDGQPPGG